MSPDAELPKKPLPPFGNCAVRRTTVIAPAAISVINARYRPSSRRAGRPMSVPSTPVIRPAMRISTGNGIEVA